MFAQIGKNYNLQQLTLPGFIQKNLNREYAIISQGGGPVGQIAVLGIAARTTPRSYAQGGKNTTAEKTTTMTQQKSIDVMSCRYDIGTSSLVWIWNKANPK